jgi:hypothetical protein
VWGKGVESLVKLRISTKSKSTETKLAIFPFDRSASYNFYKSSLMGNPVDSTEKALARKLFKLKIFESDGQAYEDLFVSVMKSKHNDFTPIEPSGSVGDRKNDGYRPDLGHYYQVHAPKELSHESRKKAAKKAREDFKGLNGFWGDYTPIKEYYFVCNDKYKGSIVEVEIELISLKSEYSLDKSSCFLSKDMEDLLFELSDDLIISHVGFIPQVPNTRLDFSILGEIINHLLSDGSPINYSDKFTSLDFGDKIRFNKLSLEVQKLLENSSLYRNDIDQYFSRNSVFAKQRLRDEIKEKYQLSRKKLEAVNSEDENLGDLIFFDVLDSITPNNQLNGQTKLLQTSALVVMAYYFETCDLFDHPN